LPSRKKSDKSAEKPSKTPLSQQIADLDKNTPIEDEVIKSLEEEDAKDAPKTEDEILEEGLAEVPTVKVTPDLSAFTTEQLVVEIQKRKTHMGLIAIEGNKDPIELVRGFLDNMPQEQEALNAWEERFIKASVKIGVDALKNIRERLNSGDANHACMMSTAIFKLDSMIKKVAKRQAELLSKA
jgi:hypothetical protein